jgi:hypothetical protein
MWRSIVILISFSILGLLAGGITWANTSFLMGLNVLAAVFGVGFVIAVGLLFFIKSFSLVDVFLPIPLSVVWSVILLPLHVSSGLFTAATAIGSGLVLSLCLWMYRAGNMSKFWIIFPIIVFLYEMLPIAIPGPFDDAFAFGGSFVSLLLGSLVSRIKENKNLLSDKFTDKDLLT